MHDSSDMIDQLWHKSFKVLLQHSSLPLLGVWCPFLHNVIMHGQCSIANYNIQNGAL